MRIFSRQPERSDSLLVQPEALLGSRLNQETLPRPASLGRLSARHSQLNLPDFASDDIWVGPSRASDEPMGFANFDFRLAAMPELFRPAGFRVAARRPSEAHSEILWAFDELGEATSHEDELRAIIQDGKDPHLMEPLLTLVKYRLLDLSKYTRDNSLFPPSGHFGVLHALAHDVARPRDESADLDFSLADRLRLLSRAGAKLDALDQLGRTPLHIAAEAGNLYALDAFIAAGANIEAACDRGMTPLNVAARYNAVACLQSLLRAGANPNTTATDEQAFGPIHWAAMTRHGGLASIASLVQHGADPMLQTATGRTPLHVAIHGRQFRNARLLLENRADPNVIDVRGITPLHRACRLRDGQAISLLLRHGADPNLDDGSGEKPLYIAMWSFADLASIQELIKKGADVNAHSRIERRQSYVGWRQMELHRPALHFACDMQFAPPSVPLEKEEINERLLEYGQMLLEYGADPNLPDLITGECALHVAARTDNTRLIDLLVRYGAKLETKNYKGRRPVDIAGAHGFAAPFRKLVELGSLPPHFLHEGDPASYGGGGGN